MILDNDIKWNFIQDYDKNNLYRYDSNSENSDKKYF